MIVDFNPSAPKYCAIAIGDRVRKMVQDSRGTSLLSAQVQLVEGLRVDQAGRASAEDHSHAGRILARQVDSRLRDRLPSRGEPHPVGAGHPPLLLRRKERVRNFGHLGRRPRPIRGRVEERELANAALARKEVTPEVLDVGADRSHRADPRDDDSARFDHWRDCDTRGRLTTVSDQRSTKEETQAGPGCKRRGDR